MALGCSRAPLLLGCLALSCASGPTSVRVLIEGPQGVTVASLVARVALEGVDGGTPQSLPAAGGAPRLPGTVLIPLPDRAQAVTVSLDGVADNGEPLHAAGQIESVPHHEVDLTLWLEGPAPPDGGVPPDLASPPDAAPPDAAPDAPICVGPRCAYLYRRRILISNGSGQALPVGYTVRVPFDPTTLSSTRSDLNDLRVFSDDTNSELDRVIDLQPPGQKPALFIALDQSIAAGATDSRHWLYYGDPNAGAPPADGTRVFLFYDDFSGTALASHWLVNGSPVVSGGQVTLRQGQQDAIATSAANDGIPVLNVLEARVSETDPQTDPQTVTEGTFYYWLGYQRTGDFMAIDPWLLWIARNKGNIQTEEKGTTACSSGCGSSGTFPQVASAFRWYRIERAPTETRFYLDGVLESTTTDVNDTDFSLMFRNYGLTNDMLIDWVRVRPLATPEPTVSLGPEVPAN